MSSIPKVSVVMPAFNSERYICDAIASVRNQTFDEWELIVVDDCSTDSTYETVYEIAQEDPRIRVIRNETNRGAAASRNAGFGQCKGKYVALLDSDDLWEPEKLQKQIAYAEKSGADIVCCSYAIIDEQGRKKAADFIVPDRTDFQSMLTKSTISCSTAMLKTTMVEQYRFPTHIYHEDLAYWLLLLKNGAQAVGITEVLASYRVTRGSRASNKLRSAINRWKIYRGYLGIPFTRSVCLLLRYMCLGVVKYRKKLR